MFMNSFNGVVNFMSEELEVRIKWNEEKEKINVGKTIKKSFTFHFYI